MSDSFDPGAVEAFTYDTWDFDEQSGVLRLRYRLGSLAFEEQFTFPTGRAFDGRAAFDAGGSFAAAVDVLHLCAGLSYYKTAAPPMVEGVPSHLQAFAAELYLHGLAEFAMTNGLDPIRPRLATRPRARSTGRSVLGDAENGGASMGALVAVGGGKDSAVTLESLRRAGRAAIATSVNTHPAIEATARAGGCDHLVIGRRLDPLLLELNDRGAHNGHVPVTAINSCALAALATGIGADAVVMSNESSASVPITTYRGLAVNHQWSKSLECEHALAALLPVPYFSLLRPLHEVEICRRFAALPDYFDVVTSCNQAYTAAGRAAGTRWCGDCPKCRFVFLALAPFLPPAVLTRIFEGHDLLADAAASDAYRGILGIGGAPPLECVGTTRESRWALARLAESAAWRDRAVVRALGSEVAVVAGWDPLAERGVHRIPADWIEVADALA